MLNGRYLTKPKTITLDANQPTSLQALDALLISQPQEIDLEIRGDLTEAIADKIIALLKLRIASFSLRVSSTTFEEQACFSKLLPSIATTPIPKLTLDIPDLTIAQQTNFYSEVKRNDNINYFMLKGKTPTYVCMRDKESYSISIDPDDFTTLCALQALFNSSQEDYQKPTVSISFGNKENANLSGNMKKALCLVLPNFKVNFLHFKIDSYQPPVYFSEVIPVFSKVEIPNLSVEVPKLNQDQIRAIFTAVRNNDTVTGFTLKEMGELEADTKLSLLNEMLLAFQSAHKKLIHLGLPLCHLNTEMAATILNILGPLGIISFDYSMNKTKAESERFDLLCAALLNPEVKLQALHLSVPFGGAAEKNQTKLFCDALTKIPRNFDLYLTFSVKPQLANEDFILLKEALFLNPRLCIYFDSNFTKLESFTKIIEEIRRLSDENHRLRTLGTRQNQELNVEINEMRKRYNSLILSGYTKDRLKDLALTKEVQASGIPSLVSIAAKKIAQSHQIHLRVLPLLSENHLELLPSNSLTQYYDIVSGIQKLSLNTSEESTQPKQTRTDIILSAFKVPSV